MKQVVAMLVLLAVIVLLVSWNAVYINNVADRIIAAVEDLPDVSSPDCVSLCASLREEWEQDLPLLNLTVSCTLTDRVCEQFALLNAAAGQSDPAGYAAARALLPDALEHLRRSDRVSLRHFFS